ncbi:calcium-activated chloride channel regulator 1-like [Glandiceps talaboti]
MKLLTSLCLSIYMLTSLATSQRNTIELQNNAYSSMLIAIHESIAEDPYLIDRIKEVFTGASSYLFVASDNRVYFKNITILIPRTWSNNLTDQLATYEQFCIANAVVDQPNPEYGDTPYVKQMRPCGELGEYMHMTSRWLTDVEFSEYYWGDSGKVVVHEWGHLRWGLFDEYPIDDDEHFYLDENGRVEPTRCSEDITGRYLNIDKNYDKCNKNPNAGVLPDPGCRFFPDLKNNKGSGSFLFANYLDSVLHFCHSDSNKDQSSYHNKLAKNKQNKHCTYRSAWEVMAESPDFVDNNNPPLEFADTVPTFRIVQEVPLRIVLVLDLSGSMSTVSVNNRFNLMIQASTKYIMYTVPDGMYIGIVQFSDDANTYTLANLTLIDGVETREQLVGALPPAPGGGTCIGCGLLKGIETLEDGPGKTAAGGVLFLVTDGEENLSPTISDVTGELIQKEVIVDTLAFSENADDQLTELSEQTNGQSFYYSESTESTGLHDAFSATITDRVCSDSETTIQLVSYKTRVNGATDYEEYVFIDSTIGEETTFFFFWETAEVKITLVSPSGNIISKGSPEYKVDIATNAVIIEILTETEVGRWNYTVRNPSPVGQIVEVSVQSKSSDPNNPGIQLTTSLSSPLITQSPPMAIIYADLHNGYSPVTGATVSAVVDRPEPIKNPSVEIQLLDNGVGADLTAGDGVYSAYFVDFVEASCPSSCRYSVQVKANDKNGNAAITKTSKVGAYPIDLSVLPTPGDPSPVGDFNRVASGGALQIDDSVQYTPPGSDLLAPGRITDLKIVATSYEDGVIVLQWTATGDDLDQGTAHHYDLRYATTFSAVFDNFDKAANITDDDVIAGNLTTPLPASQIESVSVLLESLGTGSTYYFAIKAVDEAGNVGDISNIGQTTLVPPLEESELESWEIALIVIGSVIAAGILVSVVIAMVFHYKKSAGKNSRVASLESIKTKNGTDNPGQVQVQEP